MVPDRMVLVVEDERDLADLICFNLQRIGYSAMAVHDGHSAVSAVIANPPGLVILDLMLPGLSGLDVARQIRTHPRCLTVPIIMLTARGEEADQVAGLSAGADDYVTKPFSMKVLMARVAAKLRRTPMGPEPTGKIEVGPVVIDLDAHAVTCDGLQLTLTLTEFKLLTAMLQTPKRVLGRSDLIERVMGPGIVVTTRTIDVHVASIRKKLGVWGGMIRTIRGVGYQIITNVTPSLETDETLATE